MHPSQRITMQGSLLMFHLWKNILTSIIEMDRKECLRQGRESRIDYEGIHMAMHCLSYS